MATPSSLTVLLVTPVWTKTKAKISLPRAQQHVIAKGKSNIEDVKNTIKLILKKKKKYKMEANEKNILYYC